MIPGPYSICYVDFPEENDTPVYRTLRFGYDSAEAAYSELELIAKEEGVDSAECGVVRFIDRDEASSFKD